MTRDATFRLVLLSLGVAAFLMLLMPATQLWDWDEALYGRTAIEMLQRRDWILPTFNGTVFADKPPLAYWLMGLSVSVFGQSEFAVRLPSALEMALAVWMTGRIGMKLFSARVGLFAGLILGTSLLAVYLGSSAMMDAGLLAAICAIFLALVPILQGKARARDHVFLGVALTLSMLAKGPVGPFMLVTGVPMAIFLSRSDTRPAMRQLWPVVLATVLAVACFLLWAVPANLRSAGAMLQQGINLHVITQALRPMQSHGASTFAGWAAELPYYLLVIILGLFPWTLLLPSAMVRLWRGEIGDRPARVFLWAWIVPTFVLFTLAATKLPHYILPIFPALALVMAAAQESTAKRAATWTGLGLQGFASLVFAALILVGAARLPVFASAVVYLPIAALLFLPLALAARAVLRAGRLPILAVSASTLALYLATWWLLLPAAEPGIKISRALGAALAAAATPATHVFMAGYSQPSLVFYAHLPANHVIAALPTDKAALARVLSDPAPLLIVADARAKAQLDALSQGRPFRILTRQTAINTNRRGRSQQVFLLARPAISGG